MKRVVVTGIGAITPVGNTFKESWDSIIKGVSGINKITRFDVSNCKWKVAGEIKGTVTENYLTQKELRILDPFIQYAYIASLMALDDAGFFNSKERINQSKIGLIIGSSRGGILTLEREFKKILKNESYTIKRIVSPYVMPASTISMASSFISQKLKLNFYSFSVSNACASGSIAVGEAYRLIRTGYKKIVLCGGSEAPICRICIEGYGVAGALSGIEDSSASRPFDLNRDGFVLSEGSCMLVLEELGHALKRNAKIYGEIVGYGNVTSSLHMTSPSKEGEVYAIRLALKDAGITPNDIDYISAHGTSTPSGDKIETEAIKECFSDHAYKLYISAIKSMTGHMLGGSGSLEIAFTLMSLKMGILPATINLINKDPECDLNYIRKTITKRINYAISNSFGFGGVNVVIVLKSYCP